MVKNQPTIDAFMDRRWSSEYYFLSKLYNKLLHRPTNDVVNFRGQRWVECACIRWERSRNLPTTERGRASNFLWKSPLSSLDLLILDLADISKMLAVWWYYIVGKWIVALCQFRVLKYGALLTVTLQLIISFILYSSTYMYVHMYRDYMYYIHVHVNSCMSYRYQSWWDGDMLKNHFLILSKFFDYSYVHGQR